MSSHHRSRRLALQALSCIDAQGPGAWQLVEDFIDDSRESPQTIAKAREMLRGAFDDRPESDKLLARHARRWELPRLALVDRNILRLAVYEFRLGQAPAKVIISEALRLAREFSTAESPRFVNGVLDAVAREMHLADVHDEAPPPSQDPPPQTGETPSPDA